MATLEFRAIEKVIFVPDTWTSVTCQEIYDQSMDWLDEPANLVYDTFITGSGKASLGGGEYVGITITLIDDWRLQFEARGGPGWVNCYVTGGNLVAINAYGNDPIKPSAYVNAQIRQSQSPTLLDSSALPTRMTKGVAWNNFMFLMVLSTDHTTPATSKSVSGYISKDGGSFASLTNSVAEVANGMYKVNLTSTELDADTVTLRFTASGCDDRLVTLVLQTA